MYVLYFSTESIVVSYVLCRCTMPSASRASYYSLFSRLLSPFTLLDRQRKPL